MLERSEYIPYLFKVLLLSLYSELQSVHKAVVLKAQGRSTAWAGGPLPGSCSALNDSGINPASVCSLSAHIFQHVSDGKR